MSRSIRRTLTLALVGATVTLSGCISLFPKAKPSQLYRFGAEMQARQTPQAADAVPVTLGSITFNSGGTDRLLTVTGSEVAYIKQARWIGPAEILFTNALRASFANQAQRVRLIDRREPSTATQVLNLDVTSFESRYETADSVPTVVMGVRARLIRFPERTLVAERFFETRQPASENRVAAIVAATDQAVDQVQDQIVAWTDQNAVAAPRR